MALELPPQHWRRPVGTGTSHLFAVHLTPSAEPPEAHGWKAVCGYDLHKLTGPRAGATWSGPLRTPGELTTPHKGRERSKCPKCVAVLERSQTAVSTHGQELVDVVERFRAEWPHRAREFEMELATLAVEVAQAVLNGHELAALVAPSPTPEVTP